MSAAFGAGDMTSASAANNAASGGGPDVSGILGNTISLDEIMRATKTNVSTSTVAETVVFGFLALVICSHSCMWCGLMAASVDGSPPRGRRLLCRVSFLYPPSTSLTRATGCG